MSPSFFLVPKSGFAKAKAIEYKQESVKSRRFRPHPALSNARLQMMASETTGSTMPSSTQ
jgi:hypothetical protein